MSDRNEATAFPLTWPARKKRTPAADRRRSAFKSGGRNNFSGRGEVTLYVARQRLQAELDRLRVFSAILSTNVELRLDGNPRSDRRDPIDPGAAVYFKLFGKPTVLACDTYTTVAANVAAIAAHIEAMRAQSRHGVASLEELFTGHVALPAATAPMDWRRVLGEPTSLADAERVYRSAMKDAHPDVTGGDARAAIELNAAIALARKAFA